MVITLTLSLIIGVQFFTTLLHLKPPSVVSPQRKVGPVELHVRLTVGDNEKRHYHFLS